MSAPTAAAADAKPEGAPQRKGKLGLIIGGVVALAVAGGAGWYFTRDSEPAEGEHAAEAAHEPAAPAIYVSLEPPFVVNFESASAARFLQVAVQVMTRDLHTQELLEANDPLLRNDLLLLFGGQKSEFLASREGKEDLRNQALEAVRKVVKASGGEPAKVESVLFTSFVMQ